VNRDGLARAFFDERYVVARADVCPEVRRVSRPGSLAAGLAGGPASGHLVALLEAIAVREVLPFVDPIADTVVATRVECRHRAPLAAGAEIRITGWTEHVGDREARFRVHLHDEQEQVCDGRIWIDVRAREEVALAIARKHAAIARKALFDEASAGGLRDVRGSMGPEQQVDLLL
jgi:predicted thioesterase